MEKLIDTFGSLVEEYERFCTYVGIELGSADEHMFDPQLSDSEQGYIQVFCRRWDALVKRERECVENSDKDGISHGL